MGKTVAASPHTSREQLLKRLATLRRAPAQRSFLLKHPELFSSGSVTWLSDASRDQCKIEPAAAIHLAELAMRIALKVRNRTAKARSFRAMGNALYIAGRNRDAIAYHEKAHKMFAQARDTAEVARTLSASIQPLILAGEYEWAFRNAERARSIFTKANNKWRLARVDLNAGNIFHRQDRYNEALQWYRRAHRYFRRAPEKDPEAMAVALHNIATCLVSLNDFRRALAAHKAARDFASKHNMHVLVGQTDYNIAELYYLRGEYGRAISLLLSTREICKKTKDHYHVALCLLDLSDIYLELNLSPAAEEMAYEAVQAFRKLSLTYESGKSLVNLGLAQARQNKFVAALRMLARAKRQFADEGNRVWPHFIDLYRAFIETQQGNYQRARRLCCAAIAFFRAAQIPNRLVLGQLLLAALYLDSHDLKEALAACNNALNTLKHFDLPVLHCQARQLMGRIYSSAVKPKEAYESYQAARHLFDTTRGSLAVEELKISIMEDKLEIYEGLAQICLDPESGYFNQEEALGYVEQSKSRSLLESVSLKTQDYSTLQKTSAANRKAHDLRAEIHCYSRKLADAQLRGPQSPPGRLDSLRKHIRIRENKLLRVLREMSSTDAQEAGLSASQPASLKAIRESLPPNAILVEYFQIKDLFHAAVLTRDSLRMAPLSPIQPVASVLERLHFQFAKFRLGSDYTSAFGDSLLKTAQQHLKELHEYLLAPIERELHGKHLIVVPHGPLHRLPFQALFDGTRYLIDRFSISYAPSATLYALCHKRPVNHTGPILVMGIADADAPFIADEAAAVASIVSGAQLFLGDEATTAILEQEAPHCRMIHIATHGVFRQDNPMFSGIQLGDSILSLYDLPRYRFPAELVTLSGCATGLSAVAKGDELLGLVRGLIHAGAKAAMLSLWDVQDRSTLDFMAEFYKILISGESQAVSLQRAAWRVRESYPHPYYWAPFNLIGNVTA